MYVCTFYTKTVHPSCVEAIMRINYSSDQTCYSQRSWRAVIAETATTPLLALRCSAKCRNWSLNYIHQTKNDHYDHAAKLYTVIRVVPFLIKRGQLRALMNMYMSIVNNVIKGIEAPKFLM